MQFFFGNTSYNESFFCNVTPCILSFFFVKLFLFLERERNQTRFVFFAFKKKLKKKKRNPRENGIFLTRFPRYLLFFSGRMLFRSFSSGAQKKSIVLSRKTGHVIAIYFLLRTIYFFF